MLKWERGIYLQLPQREKTGSQWKFEVKMVDVTDGHQLYLFHPLNLNPDKEVFVTYFAAYPVGP